jgi:hypothetical protein
MSKLDVVTTKLIHALCVEVHAKGPKGGMQEWAVDYNRLNVVTGGYCYKGPTGYYVPHLIPDEIKSAAWKVYAETVKG